MGQFKPMVKMETTEPSVILKLKKGGHVAVNKDENGHTNMKGAGYKAKYSEEACEGESPKKPSMSDRRKAMSGAMLNSKKGGKVSDTAQDKAMIAKAMKQHDAQEHKGGKGTKLKLATGGLTNPMKKGGSINDFLNTKTVKMKTAEGYQKYADGGAVSGNALKTVNMVTAGKATGGVVNGMATGGLTNPMKKGGKASSRPVNTGKMDPGYERYATGGLTNPMKKGGAAKKHFATGGSVSTGHAVAMPKRPVSKPVSNTNQSGTFKKGGKVGSDLVDASKGAYDKAIGPGEDEMEMAKAFRDPVGSMKKLLGMGPEPTEKQAIHAGGYKKGGNAKR